MLPVPEPRTWPEEIRTWYRGATGNCGPSDIFIFDYGQVAGLFLQDAITAAAVLDIGISEWHTERGYPAFFFTPDRIGEVQHRLGVCGYAVRVLEMAEKANRSREHKRAPVVNIASARNKSQEQKR